MRIRIIDYQGFRGGVGSVTIETLTALVKRHPETSFEIVSHGEALRRNRERADARGLGLRTIDIKPQGYWRRQRLPESEPLGQIAGYVAKTILTVPDAAFDECDVAWLPNIQRHRIPPERASRAVVTMHDVIPLQFPEMRTVRADRQDRENTRWWIASEATIVCVSTATRDAAASMFGAPPARFSIILPAFDHAQDGSATRDLKWAWARRPFLIYPAHLAPNKNHEVLFRGVGAWGAKHPLVLTGYGANLPPIPGTRLMRLRRIARESGLLIGESLHPLGHVSHGEIYGLIERAWAVVVTTLAEGFGLPLWEGVIRGIPVVCSDIPVHREQVRRFGGEVLWFNPHNPQELAARLGELERNYDELKARAVAQVGSLTMHTWDDVAEQYWHTFESVAARLGR